MRRLIRHRPSGASVIALIALIAALSGTAYAAGAIGSKQLRRGAVTSAKIKNGAVTTSKLASRAVTTAKLAAGSVASVNLAASAVTSVKLAAGAVAASNLADGAVGTTKVADAAITTTKLTPSERSEGFATSVPGQLTLPAGTDTTAARLSLPAGGHYILNAAVALGSNGAGGLISCQLLENNNPIATGNGNLPATAAFSQTISLTTTSSGGSISLTCNPDTASQAKSRAITAIRVGSLTTQ